MGFFCMGQETVFVSVRYRGGVILVADTAPGYLNRKKDSGGKKNRQVDPSTLLFLQPAIVLPLRHAVRRLQNGKWNCSKIDTGCILG
jgi:hypothetical protein